MAFIPINHDEGQEVLLPAVAATYTKGQALTVSGGNYTAAAGDQDGEVFAISMEGKVVGSSGDPLLVISTRGVKFLADCEDAPAQTDVGTFCDLASATTLDPDSSTDDLFFIESAILPLSENQVIGYFMHENPNT